MPDQPLARRNAIVLGVERPAGRQAAVALAEAGADVAVVTLSLETKAEFAANSTLNEFWAIGRKGVALTSDATETTVRAAIAEAAIQLGPISILVCDAPAPLPRAAISGLRSDPAIVVLVAPDATPESARALLEWTRDLADAGLRANALVALRALATAAGPIVKEHHPPAAMDMASATVYLVSDATAAVEDAMVVVEQPPTANSQICLAAMPSRPDAEDR
jgi:NAD(P)-dependent dehydrogenase (short-subunit alcohol dehydrogenase family)